MIQLGFKWDSTGIQLGFGGIRLGSNFGFDTGSGGHAALGIQLGFGWDSIGIRLGFGQDLVLVGIWMRFKWDSTGIQLGFGGIRLGSNFGFDTGSGGRAAVGIRLGFGWDSNGV